jgi:hypothetical protein
MEIITAASPNIFASQEMNLIRFQAANSNPVLNDYKIIHHFQDYDELAD